MLVAAADVRLHQHVLNDLLASPQWLPRVQRLEGDDTPLPSSAAASDATVLEVTNVLMEVAAAMTAAGIYTRPTTAAVIRWLAPSFCVSLAVPRATMVVENDHRR